MSDTLEEFNCAYNEKEKWAREMGIYGFAEKLERERDEARKEIEGWKNKWECAVEMAARAENECEEQAKLLAMSAEREADLLGKLDRIERAANNVILQWDLPSWKLTEPTAGVIYRLRNALGMGE